MSYSSGEAAEQVVRMTLNGEGGVVNIVNDGWEVLASRSRDNDLLSTSSEVSRSLLL